LKTSDQFDRVAHVYDTLAKLVFGSSIVASQRCFLDRIPPKANILILGGGTGWILNEIAKTNATCEIWYIDASAKMIDLAKRKNADFLRVHFIHGTEDDIPPGNTFDVLITNFYLDLFDAQKLPVVLDKITTPLARDVRWLVTDFLDRKRWQSILLSVMYSFFRVATDLKNQRLSDWNLMINRCGYTKVDSRLFYCGFIESAIFERRREPPTSL